MRAVSHDLVMQPGAGRVGLAKVGSFRTGLSACKLPRYTFFVTNAEIPMTDSGNLDRRKLRDALAKKVAEG